MLRSALGLIAITFFAAVGNAADPLPEGSVIRLGDSRWRFSEFSGDASQYAFLPDGSGLVACGQNSIRIFDAKTGAVLRDLRGEPDDDFMNVAVSLNGKYLAASKKSGGAIAWDVATGARIRIILDRRVDLDNIALSQDGKQLLGGGSEANDGEANTPTEAWVYLFDVATGKLLRKWRSDSDAEEVGFGQTGQTVFARTASRFVRWSTERDAPLSSIRLPGQSVCCANRGGSILAIGLNRGGIVFLDAASGAELGKVSDPMLAPEQMMAFSWDGKLLWTVSPKTEQVGERVRTWSVPQGKLIQEFPDQEADY